jgi:hypothetical protein
VSAHYTIFEVQELFACYEAMQSCSRRSAELRT